MVVVVYSFTIHQAVLKKGLGSMLGRCGVDMSSM